MAVVVEEHGREIVEVYLHAMREGDWRAADALMSRIYASPRRTSSRIRPSHRRRPLSLHDARGEARAPTAPAARGVGRAPRGRGERDDEQRARAVVRSATLCLQQTMV